MHLPNENMKQLHKKKQKVELNSSSRTSCVATTTGSHMMTCSPPVTHTCVVIVLAKGLAGSCSVLNQPEDFVVRKQLKLKCLSSQNTRLLFDLHHNTNIRNLYDESTWGRCECLVNLLLSLADSRGAFSCSGVRSTGEALPRGSQHTTQTQTQN